MKTKLLKFFKSKKLKKKSKSSDIKISPPFTFPRLKLRKDDKNVSTKLTNSENSSLYSSQSRITSKESIKVAKSLLATGKLDVLTTQVIATI